MITLENIQRKIKNNKLTTTVNEQNLPFFNAIAPRSAPNFHEQYYYYNNYYHTVMQVTGTSEEMYAYVFQKIVEYKNISVTFDEEYIETDMIKEFLGNDIDKGDDDLSLANKYNIFRKRKKEMQRNANFLAYLDESNEQTKLGTIRIFIKEISKERLETLVNKIDRCLKDLDIFASIQTNDLESDVKSILKFDNPVKSILPTGAVANILMHENVSIIEPQVSLLGYTKNGVYAPDFSSYKNESFCAALIGVQGSGKSSIMKRMSEDDVLNDNNAFYLDLHNGEYAGIADRFGIPSISFNEDKYINGYEIFTTVNTDGIITEKDISAVTSLMSEIYRLQSGITDNTIISLFGSHLNDMYNTYIGRNITEFNHTDWFTSTDVYNYVIENEEQNKYEEEAKIYIYQMKIGIKKMIKTYGYLFNHHTNIDIDLSKSARFDLSFLESINEENIVIAYLTILVTYLRKACEINEKYCNEHEKGLNKRTLARPPKTTRIYFEEFGTLAKYTIFLNAIDTLMRLTRKCRVGFVFALHTVQDIDIENKERESLIKSIFGLCATYIIGKIDDKTAERLPNYISCLTQSDTAIAKKFVKNEVTGERMFIACNDRGQKVKFTSIVSLTQETYFGGGV